MQVINTALKDTVQAVRTGASVVKALKIRQLTFDAPVLYVQLFNVASGSVTLGTTVPYEVIRVPAGRVDEIVEKKVIFQQNEGGSYFGTALSMACTTTPTGLTAPDVLDEPWVRIDYEAIGA